MKHVKKLNKKAGVLLCLLISAAIVCGGSLIVLVMQGTLNFNVKTQGTMTSITDETGTHTVPYTFTKTLDVQAGDTHKEYFVIDTTSPNAIIIDLATTFPTTEGFTVTILDGAENPDPITSITIGGSYGSTATVTVEATFDLWIENTSITGDILFTPGV